MTSEKRFFVSGLVLAGFGITGITVQTCMFCWNLYLVCDANTRYQAALDLHKKINSLWQKANTDGYPCLSEPQDRFELEDTAYHEIAHAVLVLHSRPDWLEAISLWPEGKQVLDQENCELGVTTVNWPERLSPDDSLIYLASLRAGSDMDTIRFGVPVTGSESDLSKATKYGLHVGKYMGLHGADGPTVDASALEEEGILSPDYLDGVLEEQTLAAELQVYTVITEDRGVIDLMAQTLLQTPDLHLSGDQARYYYAKYKESLADQASHP